MRAKLERIPDRTLEAFARGFFSDARLYGFKQSDFIRFVNYLLDMAIAMKKLKGNLLPFPENISHVTTEYLTPDMVDVFQLPIIGKKVTIRDFNIENDLAHFKNWINKGLAGNFLLSCSGPEILDYKEFFTKPQHHFGIISLNSGQSIGLIAYLNHDPTHHRGELRKLIADPCLRGLGYGKEATQLWLHYGKIGLQIKKVYLTTLDTNTRNIHLNEVLGFKVEGILRNEIFFEGRYRDVLRMGLWLNEL